MALSPHALTSTLAATSADPILAAIGVHRAAWIAFAQATPEAADGASVLLRSTLASLLDAPCTTRAGAEALLRHLRACLAFDETAPRLDPRMAYLVAARVGELVRFLDRPNLSPPVSLGEAAGRVIRALVVTGEAMAALSIVVGGGALVGLASLL